MQIAAEDDVGHDDSATAERDVRGSSDSASS